MQVRNKKMKRLILKIGTTLAIAAGMFWNVSAQAQTLSASDITNCSTSPSNCRLDCLNWTDSITGSLSPKRQGGFWCGTYLNNSGFTIGSFKLSHNSGMSQYSYWGGFTSGSNGDSARYSIPCVRPNCDSTHSAPWVDNQWGVMARGGLTTPPAKEKGQPYLIAYWDYFNTENNEIDMNNQSVIVSLADDAPFDLDEMWICNHPWPYWGNICGDGFARPLNQPGDRFDLIIHGVYDGGGEIRDTVNLAKYDTTAPHGVAQSRDWRQLPFGSLEWSGLKYIYFTMYSTDTLVIGDTNYGPNTAVYFCMDKLTVTPSSRSRASSSKAVVVQQVQKSASVPLPPIEVTDYFPIASYTGGGVIVYDTSGKEVLKTTVGAGEKINLSMLPAGNYRLQHGHKVIPFNKK